jgi:hypothetical protein
MIEQIKDGWWDLKFYLDDQVDKVKYWWKTCVVCTIVLILLLWIFTGWLILEKDNIKVTDKGNKIKSGQTLEGERLDTYYIYTESHTYSMKDNTFYLRFASADDYGKLIIGKCYTVWSLGMRIGVLDMYENILYFSEIEC